MCCLSVGEKVVLLQMIMFFSMGARLSFSMYKRLMFICAVSVFVLLVGCKKCDDGMRFSIFTEPFNGGVKVEVNGLESSWRTGDQVWVNGQTGAVEIVNNNSVLTMDEAVDNWNRNYYAAYPASMVTSGNQNGELTVSLPQVYQYNEDATTYRQLLELPMVATTTNDQIAFKHLTGALIVKVQNTTNRNIMLDYVMVQSSTSALSGTGTVDVDANNPQMIFDADTTHTVIMYFDEHHVTMRSDASTTKDIMIPIAPTSGVGHQFTVTVRAHTQNSPYLYYLFNGKSTGGNMARNEVGIAPVSNLPEGHFVGQGTPANPYLIQNKEDYKHFVHCVCMNKLNEEKYKLVNDINFHGATVILEAPNNGIGKFFGVFNGNGKQLKNASVQGARYVLSGTSHYYLSLFPALAGGVVKDLSVSDVNLIAPQGNSLSNIYAGGLSCHVEAYSGGASIQNVQVSNVSFDYPSTSSTVSNVFIGGIVGKVEENGSGTLTMTSCRYEQQTVGDYSVSSNAGTVYWGGLIGMADGADVTLAECQVGFGGNQQTTGTTVNSSASSLNYVGGAIGKSTNNTVQITTSLLLEGHIQFTGRYNNSVRKIIGSASTVLGDSLVDKSNLYFWMRTNADSGNTVAPD